MGTLQIAALRQIKGNQERCLGGGGWEDRQGLVLPINGFGVTALKHRLVHGLKSFFQPGLDDFQGNFGDTPCPCHFDDAGLGLYPHGIGDP